MPKHPKKVEADVAEATAGIKLSDMILKTGTLEDLKAIWDSEEFKKADSLESYLAGILIGFKNLNLRVSKLEEEIKGLKKPQQSG